MKTSIVKHVNKGGIALIMLMITETCISYTVMMHGGKSYNYVNSFISGRKYTYTSTYAYLGESRYDSTKEAELIVSLVNKYVK